jgi:two-component system, cell cycle sensor histidine kinase and response regulator CckA
MAGREKSAVEFGKEIESLRAELRALRETESIYQQTIEAARGVPYRHCLSDGSYSPMGAGAKAIFGVPAEEMTFERFLTLIQSTTVTDPEVTCGIREYAEAFRQGKVERYRTDVHIRTPQGEDKWLSDTAVPLRDEKTGAVTHSLGILVDITERRRVEIEKETLGTLAKRLTAPLSLHEVGKIAAEESRGLFGHNAFEIMLFDEERDLAIGIYGEDTPMGGTEPVFMAPDNDSLQVVRGLPSVLTGKSRLLNRESEPERSEFQVFGEEGRLSLSLMFVPILWAGEVIGELSVQSYIADRYGERDLRLLETFSSQCGGALMRVRVEEALRESEERFRGIYHQSPVGVEIFDAEGRLLDVNPAYLEIFGVESVEEIRGFQLFEDPNLPEEVKDRLRGSGIVKANFPFDFDLVREKGLYRTSHTGQRQMEVIITPLRGPGKTMGGFLVHVTDITDRRRSENGMLRASRMEATATLAGGIAHDFNNLMVGVLGNAELLREDLASDHAAVGMIRDIIRSARRAGDLAQQMLAFAQGGKYHPQRMSLNEVVRKTLRLQRGSLPPKVEVEQDVDPQLWSIVADPSQMSQILMNLCLNAVEATAGRGSIRVTTRNAELSGEDVRDRPGLLAGRHVRLTVEDNGCGMDAETIDRVFEPFFTTKFQGRGLGLSAVYGIVKNHGGHIAVKSQVGHGSTLVIHLPAVDGEGGQRRDAGEASVGAIEGEKIILVVDDEEVVLDMAQRALERIGHCILTATNGREALEIAERHEGEIHLALLDLGMPVMDGEEVFPLLRQARPQMPIVLCSGFGLDATARRLLDAGAVAFIQKPFRLNELLPVIERVLGEEPR